VGLAAVAGRAGGVDPSLYFLKRPAPPATTRGNVITMAGNLLDVTDTTFQAEVLESEKPVLVDFWAAWCGPCRVVAPILEEIASERDDLRIVKMDIDANPHTTASLGILAIPTMILFRDGAEAARIQGSKPRKRLEAELEPALA